MKTKAIVVLCLRETSPVPSLYLTNNHPKDKLLHARFSTNSREAYIFDYQVAQDIVNYLEKHEFPIHASVQIVGISD